MLLTAWMTGHTHAGAVSRVVVFGLLASLGVVPRSAAAQPAGFSPSGTYALRLVVGHDTVPFQVIIADSAGRWAGEFVGTSGRRRPLVAVVARADSAQVIVQYADPAGFATMLLRVRADSVRGATEYADGTFPIFGTRTATSTALPARPSLTPAKAP